MEKIKLVTVKYDDYNMYGYYKSVLVGAWESLRGYYGITGNSYGGWSMCTNRSTEWNGSACLVYEKLLLMRILMKIMIIMNLEMEECKSYC